MQGKITIVVAVDTVAALSDQSLDDNIFLMDDGDFDSDGKGTALLVTRCYPGQLIKWNIYPVDLQTPAAIKKITFLPPGGNLAPAKTPAVDRTLDGEVHEFANLGVNSWSGYAPGAMIPGLAYNYRLEIQIGEGKDSSLHIDTPALQRITP